MNIKSISTVLISKDEFYLWNNWELPSRPEGDKQYITNLIKDKVVLTSKATLDSLPNSIIKKAKEIHTDEDKDFDINFWIWTFKKLSDMFIIIKSTENLGWGKKFKMEYINENYNLIMDINNIQMFLKK